MLMNDDSPGDRWHGWAWIVDHWQLLCSAVKMDSCAGRLYEQAQRRGIPSKYTCMTGGGPPRYVPYDYRHKENAQ